MICRSRDTYIGMGDTRLNIKALNTLALSTFLTDQIFNIYDNMIIFNVKIKS